MDKDLSNFTEDQSADYRNRNIGFVFQEHLLLPHLTVRENILLPLLAMKQSTEDARIKGELRANAHEENRYPRSSPTNIPETISGGEAQRAALVRAL